MPDVQSTVLEFVNKLRKRKIEGSQATAKCTVELLRSVISQQRVPHSNQASALIDAVKAVGEQLVAANPVELAVGNVVRRVLHIIREEDLSLATAAMAGLDLLDASDDDGEDDNCKGVGYSAMSAAVAAAAARSTLRPPSLQTLLEGTPESAAVPYTSSSGADSESKNVQSTVLEFVNKLRKRKIEGSQATAKCTVELLRSVISQQRVPHSNQASALIDAVKAVGEQLVAANPVELAVGNVVRRVLHIIREEDLSLATAAMAGLDLLDASDDDGEDDNCKGVGYSAMSAAVAAAAARSTLRPPSLQTLLEGTPESAAVPYTSSSGADSESKRVLGLGKFRNCRKRYDSGSSTAGFLCECVLLSYRAADKSSITRKLKHDVIEGVNHLILEISGCHEQIAEQAIEHIHQNEVILTLGSSRTVPEFLCAAKEKKRSFRVFVAEGAPRYQGHLLAKELVARGLQTTVITDSAVFAMISRVNMVIIGAHAVMANGGVIGPVGVNMAALAAKKHAVPFVVLAGSHKLCPLYPHNPEVLLNELRSPSELLDFGEVSDCLDFGAGSGSPLLQVVNPTFDYVPPSLVSLFITDTGGHNPSYMYRLIADYYSADDLVM
ncbi:hypothetical protein F2Q68_00018132 [Brassica cretica]|uniref:Translation initiation factor eIF2B subunit beta n=1 Tax=Brassica cretica TaxID=69181 RepID=A0A8S9HFR2_BRACR|nr:hypothetical protein F2Q68_00018132 [Brassica cretica]